MLQRDWASFLAHASPGWSASWKEVGHTSQDVSLRASLISSSQNTTQHFQSLSVWVGMCMFVQITGHQIPWGWSYKTL